MEVIIQKDADRAGRYAARWIARLVQNKPAAVLGLATGSTPLSLYQELIRMHHEKGLDFSRVTTLNLDEYVGLPPDHPQSYRRFMQENFVNVRKLLLNVHVISSVPWPTVISSADRMNWFSTAEA